MKNIKEGALTLISLPIGNLKDITIRALEELNSSDLIFCEDTRTTLKILNHYNIKCKLHSYHEHSNPKTRKFIIDEIKKGKCISLVSDAGTPLISDPGFKLVKELKSKNIKITSCPGPSSPIAALIMSGLPTDKFFFSGFLPVKIKAKKEYLTSLKNFNSSLIFFESSKRLLKSLEIMLEIFGDRNMSVCRELTKKFEEVISYKISDVIKNISSRKSIKGEIVIVVEGSNDLGGSVNIDRILIKMLATMSLSDAAKEISKFTNLSRKEVYNAALKLKGKKSNES
ncbi:MAG: 16S rRNA (cytidine(1402)-2'-O)-methyltransferase [Rhizobiales bacterium TMED168]|nr:MAG: 16S rRNA (cytidine(1402)-2'-O)-methyltransferase [Rhizobiales bacterium TMED168]